MSGAGLLSSSYRSLSTSIQSLPVPVVPVPVPVPVPVVPVPVPVPVPVVRSTIGYTTATDTRRQSRHHGPPRALPSLRLPVAPMPCSMQPPPALSRIALVGVRASGDGLML